jgi:hypothetical protein
MTDNNSPEDKRLGPSPADVPLNELLTVELTNGQLQDARRVAEARNESYQRINGGRVCGNQTSKNAHVTGVFGELVYANQYDEQVDNSVYARGDNGYDFAGPLTIDVKSTGTHIDRPALIVSTEPKPVADLYFLVHRIEEQVGRIIGFATRSTVVDRTAIRKPGDELNYVVEQEELWLPPDMRDQVDDKVANP